MKKHLSLILTLSTALSVAACGSPRENMTIRDSQGRYITTSEFRSMNRAEFFDAMEAGLEDFEQRVSELRERSNELGGDTLAEFADHEEDLTEARVGFENQLEIAESALAEDWPDERSNTVECYYEMREDLEDAYEDVLEQ